MCALTVMINKLVDQMPSFPAGNELLQEATDAFALIANANTELNHRRREFIKPDLHNDYKHLSSSSLAITDQLFGDDLPWQVKDLTEDNCVGKKMTTSSGSFTRSQCDSRNPRNYTSRSSSHGRGYRNTWKPFLECVLQQSTNKPSKEDKARKDEIVTKSRDPVSSVDVEVSKHLQLSNDFIAGCLKQFSSQWQHITSDPFILDSVQHNKIEFLAEFQLKNCCIKE